MVHAIRFFVACDGSGFIHCSLGQRMVKPSSATCLLAMPRRLRSIIVMMLLAMLLVMAGAWLWGHPSIQALVFGWQLRREPIPDSLPVPVQGVRASRIADTWGGIRSGGRRHEGVDIFAPRGTPVRSSSDALVLAVRDRGLGGKQVWTLGPGGERHYYAHLDSWADGLQRLDRLRAGDPIGQVGDTGNARGNPPHLHYGIYGINGARNPHPLLRDAPDDWE